MNCKIYMFWLDSEIANFLLHYSIISIEVALLEDQELRLSLAFGTHVKQFLQIFWIFVEQNILLLCFPDSSDLFLFFIE